MTKHKELLREAADSVHASLAETDISDDRRKYRVALEERLRKAGDSMDVEFVRLQIQWEPHSSIWFGFTVGFAVGVILMMAAVTLFW